jgi:protein involved in polysaccharide export with SLBB domain
MYSNALRALPLLVLLSLGLAGCAAPPFDARAVAEEWSAYMQSDYKVRPYDVLSIQIQPDDKLVAEIQVPPSGKVTFPDLKDEVQVLGRSFGGLRQELTVLYGKRFEGNFILTLSLLKSTADSVYVAGEVKRPGVVPYAPTMTLTQALATAGGLMITAKGTDIRILRNEVGRATRTFRVDYDGIIFREQPDFLVLPGDVIYCQTSGIGEAGYQVDLWIRRLIPFNLSATSIGTN